MVQNINVKSLKGIEEWKASLKIWVNEAGTVINMAEIEVRRVEEYIRNRDAHWSRKVQSCREEVRNAKQALHDCRCDYRDCSEEEHDLELALSNLNEAEEELKTVKYWARRLEEGISPFRSQANRMKAILSQDGPRAEKMLRGFIEDLYKGKRIQIAEASSVSNANSPTLEATEKEIESLSASTVNTIEELIAKGKRKEALELLLSEISSSNTEFGRWLRNNPNFPILYDPIDSPETSATAVTSFDPETWAPLKTSLGDLSFGSAAWLYSSLLHELLHPKQIGSILGNMSIQEFISNKDRHITRLEFSTTAWEIKNAHITGVSNHLDEILILKSHINEKFKGLDPTDQTLFRADYDYCLDIIDQMASKL